MRLPVIIPLIFFGFMLAQSVFAVSGSGIISVSPTIVASGSNDNTFTFSFQATEPMPSGELILHIPDGWSKPTSDIVTPGYTTVASDMIMLADVIDPLNVIGGWSSGTACSQELSIDTTFTHEGAGALVCKNGNEKNNDRWYINFVEKDWSHYTHIGFWIYSDTAIKKNQLWVAYDDNDDLQNPIDQIPLTNDIDANTWTYMALTLGPQPKSSVKSLGFIIRTPTELDNSIIHIDDILLGPGQPVITGSTISLRFLLADSGSTLTILYGAGGGTSGVTTPALSGEHLFLAESRPTDTDTVSPLSLSPTITTQTDYVPTPETHPTVIQKTGVQISIINFSGIVFPDAQVTLLVHKTGKNTPIRQETFPVADGRFGLYYNTLLPGAYTFGIQVKDKEGQSTPVKFYSLSLLPRSSHDILFFAPPTVALPQTIIRRGDPVTIEGFMSPENSINAFIDDQKIHGTATVQKNGQYTIVFSTTDLSYGDHALTVQQKLADGTTSDMSIRRIFTISKLFTPRHDLNTDGNVNIQDWSIFSGLWHMENTSSTERQRIDLNHDGKINISDFSIFIQTLRFYAL